ncbi:MAG TPA: glycosyltransferase family 4 protein [Armatimonadota bacterium]|nr:glycosyltransferase family 4 protein [Armatimonadota bacterium]
MSQYTILHTEASTGWGGQEIRIINESVGMIERGHRVLLVCQPTSVISKKASEQGIETVVMPIRGAFDVKGIRRLRALYRDEKVDIVNTHSSKDSWCAGLAAKLAGGVKVIRTRHLSIPIKNNFESRLLYRTLPDAIVTTGEAIRKHIIERTDANPEIVVSIPTGIDLEAFDPLRADRLAFRKEIGVDPEAPLIGTVGMLRAMKGYTHLLNAAAEVIREFPSAMFTIVGDTAFESNIKDHLAQQMAELGIADKVKMPGYREDADRVMAGLDVFVLASTRSEGVPQVITQAMAMKRPVIGTNVGSVYEQIIDKETGFLVEKANSAQIRDSILALLRNPDMAKRMGENGRKLVEERFSLDTMLDKTEALYARLMSNAQA